MKQLLLSATALILCSGFLFAQKNSRSNDRETLNQTSFYAEIGGPGILFSANIDKRFTKSHLGWGGRIGLGFVSGYLDDNNNYYDVSSVVTVPVQFNYIFGKSNSPHTFEVGGGVTITGKKIEVFDFYDDRSSSFFGTASFMYRRQPVNGGFTWRIGFTPIISKGYIQPFAGAGVGYNF
jgi:hypothetical protein